MLERTRILFADHLTWVLVFVVHTKTATMVEWSSGFVELLRIVSFVGTC